MLSTLRTTISRNASYLLQKRAINSLHKNARAFCSQKPQGPEASSAASIENDTVKVDASGAVSKVTLKDKISMKAPLLGKVTDFLVDSWEQTFPSDKYKLKAEQTKREAKLAAEREKMKPVFTEEELAQAQESIPEWKRTAMAAYDEELVEPKSLKEKMVGKLKEKFNQTEVAQKLYQTEQYKEYEDFKKEMSQFKEDYKDHLTQSQNIAVIASVALYNKATVESNTAQAIKEMRKLIKGFDVFELERDAKGIFNDVYNAYLEGNTEYLAKVCEDEGLAYFKSLLKRNEAQGVYPKYTQVWESEQASFIGGKMSEKNLPCFTYTVCIQEIHCYLSKKTKEVVDGADDKLLQNKFNVAISLHENPDLENVGHRWSIVSVIPIEAVPLLA